jgi:hypothetical protein
MKSSLTLLVLVLLLVSILAGCPAGPNQFRDSSCDPDPITSSRTAVLQTLLLPSDTRVSSSAGIFAASVNRSALLFTRPNTSAHRSSLVLIAVLFNRTSSGGLSVGDISNEGRRGHYQRGATPMGSLRVNAAGQMGLVATCPAILPGEWNYLRVVRYSHAISGKR